MSISHAGGNILVETAREEHQGAANSKRVTSFDSDGNYIDLGTETTLSVINNKLPDESGTWSYESATLTSGNLSATGRCLGIRVFAQGGDGTFNINGGDVITIRQSAGVDIAPRANLTNPTVNWVSGTLDVFIEVVS